MGLEEKQNLRYLTPSSGWLHFTLDGEPYPALPGETLAAALYDAGKRAWRRARNGESRGLLCGMGICFDCLVTVDGQAGLRACQMLVREGMAVTTNLPGEEEA